ncbi:MAG: TonB-dependent receptor plug domain-containing protein [Lacibacter sp.]
MRLFFTAFLLSTCLFVTAQVKPSLPIKPSAQPRVFDGKMMIQRCSVAVKTDGITAVTFVEMEFYNNQEVEIEGLYRFKLRNGQVVTDFQLDLNGKYREGSIEEKWKATNAYNRVVGKRIDPALLTKDYDNNYSLRIYPVPAKKTRKVCFTLHEVLPYDAKAKTYMLPFSNNDTVADFSFRFEAYNQTEKPFSRAQTLLEVPFTANHNGFVGTVNRSFFAVNKLLEIVLPQKQTEQVLVQAANNKQRFAVELKKEFKQFYSIEPKSVTVFWDASASSTDRDLQKEISFLKQYLAYHRVKKVTVIPFRQKPFDTLVLATQAKQLQQLDRYLTDLSYEAATGYGSLNFSTVQSDVVLLFSDGYNSYGTAKPKSGRVLVYAIHSAQKNDLQQLKKITGAGGVLIDLRKLPTDVAVEQASQAERMLLRVESASGKTIIESVVPEKIDRPVLIYGTMHSTTDTLHFYYGNNELITNTETVILSAAQTATAVGIDRLHMLMRYRKINESYNWNDILDFGLDERVVTTHSAFIVFERVEDYIQYNITPSKDLEEECRRLNYVKLDTRKQRRLMENKSTEADLSAAVAVYNQRIKKWDASAPGLFYRPEKKEEVIVPSQTDINILPTNNANVEQALQGRVAGVSISSSSALDEVVVIGYGVARKSNLTGSVTVINQQNIFQGYTNIGDALTGRVAGLQVMNNGGAPGAAPDIRIRGASSFGASAQPLYVIDGVPVMAESINQILNVNDIESITVLKDASATAMYGSRAANGAIVIQMKKGKNYSNNYSYNRKYKLSEQEDVDYILEMKDTERTEKVAKYNELKLQYGTSVTFHVDMAEHFYACRLHAAGFAALTQAMELAPSQFYMQRTAAMILERWKQFVQAEELLSDLVADQPTELYLYRDLAWVYYQQKKYQQAVDLLHKALFINFGADENRMAGMKAILLNDFNAMIEMQKHVVNRSKLNASLIKPLPVDLMIVAEGNSRDRLHLQINEPGLQSMVIAGNPSKSGGFITTEQNIETWNYYNHGIEMYSSKNAVSGKYKLTVNYYGSWSYYTKIPNYIRLCVFRNFGKPDQSIQIETIAMDNQYGEIEIAEIKY